MGKIIRMVDLNEGKGMCNYFPNLREKKLVEVES